MRSTLALLSVSLLLAPVACKCTAARGAPVVTDAGRAGEGRTVEQRYEHDYRVANATSPHVSVQRPATCRRGPPPAALDILCNVCARGSKCRAILIWTVAAVALLLHAAGQAGRQGV